MLVELSERFWPAVPAYVSRTLCPARLIVTVFAVLKAIAPPSSCCDSVAETEPVAFAPGARISRYVPAAPTLVSTAPLL